MEIAAAGGHGVRNRLAACPHPNPRGQRARRVRRRVKRNFGPGRRNPGACPRDRTACWAIADDPGYIKAQPFTLAQVDFGVVPGLRWIDVKGKTMRGLAGAAVLAGGAARSMRGNTSIMVKIKRRSTLMQRFVVSSTTAVPKKAASAFFEVRMRFMVIPLFAFEN